MSPMTESGARQDVFPTTMMTWLGDRVRSGGNAKGDANRHIMEVYAHPMKVYFLGSSFRWMGEPDDMVQGFFADRLTKEDYLSKWLESGRPLRFWLIVGFKHYLLEQARRMRKERREVALPPQYEESAEETDEAFDKACAMSIVAEALRRTEQDCHTEGLDAHWRIFVRHYRDGHSYQIIAPEYGVDRARAAVMARTAASRFKKELRELVGWDGAESTQIDHEIGALLEASGS